MSLAMMVFLLAGAGCIWLLDKRNEETRMRAAETAEQTAKSEEERTESTRETGAVFSEEAIYITLQQGEEDVLLFDSSVSALQFPVITAGEIYQVQICNYTAQDVYLSLYFADEDMRINGTRLGGDVPCSLEVPEKSRMTFDLEPSASGDMVFSLYWDNGMKQQALLYNGIGNQRFLEEKWTAETLKVTLDGPSEDFTDLLGNLPYCVLEWNNGAISGEQLARAANVALYNGQNPALTWGIGGISQGEITSIVMAVEDNPFLTETLTFTLSGNTWTVYYPYAVSEADMANVKLRAECSEGTLDFGEGFSEEGVSLLTEQTLTITDALGQSRTYVLQAKRLTAEIPVVYLYTEGGEEITSRTDYVQGTFSMDCSKTKAFSSLETVSMKIRGRGHSTWKWDKKPYKIKFSEKQSLLGLAANKDWVLLANYVDRSQIRNYLSLEMAKTLKGLDFTPTSYPVDVFLNGSYIGIYSLGEQIEAATSRVDIAEEAQGVDTAYLLEIGGYEEGDVYGVEYFNAGTWKNVKIKSPDTKSLTPEQISNLQAYLEAADQAVVTGGNYEAYVDMNSFLDWLILTEFTYNTDAGFYRSVYLTKEGDGKLQFGPVWDFDLALGNLAINDSAYQSWATSRNGYVGTTWTTYLYEDETFMEQFRERWNAVKDTLLDTALQVCEEMTEKLSDSWNENQRVWPNIGIRLAWEWEFMTEMTTLKEQIQYLEQFLEGRYAFLDAVLNDGLEPDIYEEAILEQ